jgi:hypothetical protein
MKIDGIKKARSKKGELVLVTNPPLTEEVFYKFQEAWNVTGFTMEDDLLIWTGPPNIDKEFIRQTNIYLTEAENQIKTEKTRTEGGAEQYQKEASERTGLPLL